MTSLMSGENAVAYVEVPDNDGDEFERETHGKSVNKGQEGVPELPPAEKEASAADSRRTLCCSLFSLVMSIPALIGA
jgi:hypothetical protein